MKILILIIFAISSVFSESYYVKKDLPGELKLIFQSLAKIKLNEKEKKMLDDIVWHVDRYFTSMEKEEIFFLIKVNVYKTILEFKKKNKRILSISPEEMENLVGEKLKSAPYSEFSKWLLRAIISDYKNIIKTKNYKIIHGDSKKLQLIMPWYFDFINLSMEEFELNLKDLYFLILKKISLASMGLLNHSRFNYKESPSEKLAFFEYREPALLIQPDTLDNILAIPSEPADSSPVAAPWRPRGQRRDDDLLKDPDYIPPEKLPESIDEKLWARQGGMDIEYIPPDKLPEPVDENKWEE